MATPVTATTMSGTTQAVHVRAAQSKLPHKNLLIVREDMHIGSFWMTNLLEKQNISTFFQFNGDCSPFNGKPKLEPVEALQRLLEDGCKCPRNVGAITRMSLYCKGNCRRLQPDPSCQAVAVVGVHLSTAEPLVAAGKATIVTMTRENTIKTSISHIKDRCGKDGGLANHALARNVNSTLMRTPILMWIDPHIFAAQVLQNEGNRRRFDHDTARRLLPVAQHAGSGLVTTALGTSAEPRMSYEAFQLQPSEAMRKLMSELGLAYIVSSEESLTVKTSSEILEHKIINFDSLNRSISLFTPAPAQECLQTQLLSRAPETANGQSAIDRACAAMREPNVKVRWRSKLATLPGDTAILDCESRRCYLPNANHVRPILFDECLGDPVAGHRICDLAAEKLAQHRHPNATSHDASNPAIHVCVRTLIHNGGGPDAPKTSWLRNFRLP